MSLCSLLSAHINNYFIYQKGENSGWFFYWNPWVCHVLKPVPHVFLRTVWIPLYECVLPHFISPGVDYLYFFLNVLYHSNSTITALDVFVRKPSCAFFPVSLGWILINGSSESRRAHFLVPGATLTSERLRATSSAESEVLLSLAPSQILLS